MILDGKTILATGTGSGLGAVAVRLLAQRGAEVVVADLNAANAEALAGEIVSAGGRASHFAYDQSDEGSIRALVSGALARHGRIDGLFANAADVSLASLHGDVPAVDMDAALWTHVLAVNLTGTALLAKYVVPHMLERGSGSIVCTSSVASLVGYERPAYAASKAGVNALVRHLAFSYGRSGLRANAIAPGPVLTDAMRNNLGEEGMAQRLTTLRSPRLGLPSDVASAVSYLLSDEAEWINGQTIRIDGGTVMT